MGRGLGLDQQLGWLGAWRHDLEDGPRRACSNQPAAGGRRRQQRRHRQQPTCCSTRHTAPPPSRHAEANRVQGGVIRPKPTASPSWSGMPGRWPRANLHRGRRAISSNAHHAATPPTTDGHSMLRSVRLVDLTHAGRDGPRPPPDNPRDTRAPTRRSWAGGVAVANRKHVWSRAGSPTMVPRAAHQRRRPIHACRCRSSRPTCTGSGEARPVDGARPPTRAGPTMGPTRRPASRATTAPAIPGRGRPPARRRHADQVTVVLPRSATRHSPDRSAWQCAGDDELGVPALEAPLASPSMVAANQPTRQRHVRHRTRCQPPPPHRPSYSLTRERPLWLQPGCLPRRARDRSRPRLAEARPTRVSGRCQVRYTDPPNQRCQALSKNADLTVSLRSHLATLGGGRPPPLRAPPLPPHPTPAEVAHPHAYHRQRSPSRLARPASPDLRWPRPPHLTRRCTRRRPGARPEPPPTIRHPSQPGQVVRRANPAPVRVGFHRVTASNSPSPPKSTAWLCASTR
jgi:hypothetical protein